VHELVSDAVHLGATVVTGGEPLAGPGYFYRPTVLTHVPAASRVLSEEIFGPVAPIVSFATEEEAIARANATEYGLMGYVFTRDFNRALRVAEALDTGMVGLNQGVASNAAAPFGGIKQSGFGREGGAEGIDEYLSLKYVGIGV
jgi:succinate-semialdehyde dehydrogenase/glutarate-semialdehyde dehydrogenase